MKNVYGSRVLVTGASSGIGKAAAELFAQNGCQVLGVSRHPEEAHTGAGVRFAGGGVLREKALDVTDEASIAAALSGEEFDIVFLAAGMGVAGPAETVTASQAHRQMEVNYEGVLNVVRAVLPSMRAQKRGLVMIVSSVAGRIPIPMQSHYSSSKFALEAYGEALRMETASYGIRVVLLEPGDTATGFTDSRRFTDLEGSPYKEVCLKSVARMEHDERNGRSPDSVGKVALKMAGKKNPPVRVAIGTEYKLLLFAQRLLPYRLAEFILRKLYLPE